MLLFLECYALELVHTTQTHIFCNSTLLYGIWPAGEDAIGDYSCALDDSLIKTIFISLIRLVLVSSSFTVPHHFRLLAPLKVKNSN